MQSFIIAANPGWDIVSGIFGDDNKLKSLLYEPVIAWLLFREEGAFEVTPITVEGPVSDNDDWYFRRPDGSFLWAYVQEFLDGEPQVIEQLQRVHNKKVAYDKSCN